MESDVRRGDHCSSRSREVSGSAMDGKIGGDMEVNKDLLIEALQESTELLREDSNRYRESNRRLRAVNSMLRQQILILLKAAEENDAEFTAMCQALDAPVENVQASGLLDS